MKFLSFFTLALLQVSSVFAVYDIDPNFTEDEKRVLLKSIQETMAEKRNAAQTFQALGDGELPPQTEDIIKRLLGSHNDDVDDSDMVAKIRALTHFATAHWFSDVKWHESPSRRVSYIRKLKEDVDKKGRGTGKTTLTFYDAETGEKHQKTFSMPTKDSVMGLTFHHPDVPNHAIVWHDRDLYKNTDKRSDNGKDYRSGVEIARDGLRTFMMKDMFSGMTINRVLPHEVEHVPVDRNGYAVVQDSPYENGKFNGKVKVYDLGDLIKRADEGKDLTRNAEFFNHIARWTMIARLGVTISEMGNVPLAHFAAARRAPDSKDFMNVARTKYPKLKISKDLCRRGGSCGLDSAPETQPTTPNDPNAQHPTDPNKPVDPNAPKPPTEEDPNQPTEPTTEDPNAPTEPVDPNKPVNPDDPNAPVDPNKPKPKPTKPAPVRPPRRFRAFKA